MLPYGKTLRYSIIGIGIVAVCLSISASANILTYHGTHRCTRYDRGDGMVGSVECLDQLPTLSVEEQLEYILGITQDITTEYNAGEREFTYTPSQLIVEPQTKSRLDLEWNAVTASSPSSLVMVPKLLIAYQTQDRFKYVASTRDTTIYGPCRKQNYDLAMNELNGVVLEPDELLNMNTLIANKPGYCTGGGSYLFFSGVCGGSTQLFWNAILHPGLEVVERHSHSQRYAGFYGSTVMGDDSSIYERSKKLVIKNTTDSAIGFGTFVRERDQNTVLVSARQSTQDRETLIQKEQHGPRKAMLHSTIYDTDTILQRDSRTSTYYGIDTSIDETATQNDL